VPVISAFFGILIRMYYKEHDPPHFHAEHAGEHATFTFDGLLLAGTLRSRRARDNIASWAALHRPELEANWAAMKRGATLERIEPLK
jgi:hypothetical protein